MLVTFYCNAYENITMFGDVAKKILNFMQHSGEVPGAIVAKEVPNALESLKTAIDKHKSIQSHLPNFTQEDEEPDIGIEKRAVPIIALLEAAVKAKCDVLWRVG
ncbi:MAG: DUF1840 domain-containing protein [Legionellaceae bacterium]|nr:DUF1840 domain-containing protein [Legionellaceae bacterium]